MAKLLLSQNNFNAGEISPRMYARTDIDKYKNALQLAQNCYVAPHGPAIKRNGTKFINEVQTSADGAVRLVSFQFNPDTAVILEFGDLYIRFYADGGVLLDGGSPYEVVTTYTTAQVADLSWTQFGNVIYLVHPDVEPKKLTRTSSIVWTLESIGASPAPTYESGFAPATTGTPAAATGLGINFTAGAAAFLDADIGRQIVNLVDTGIASITAVSSSTVVVCDILEDFPNTSAIASGDWKMDLSPISALTPTGTKIGSIITLDSDLDDGGTTAVDTFRSTDVGKFIYLNDGVVEITEYTSAAAVNGVVLKSLTAVTETSVWSMETETWTSARGYPRAVGVYQQRIVYGGSAAMPQTLWFSETGIFDGFGTGSLDDDAIEVSVSSSKVNEINWIAAGRDLVVGTSGAEITINGGTAQTAITPSTIQQIPRTYHGSNRHIPVVVGNEVLFVQGSERSVRSFRYDFNVDGYVGEDLHFLARHLTSGLIKEMAYAQDPDSVIYAVTQDGDLLAGTYVRDQKVIGWTKFIDTDSYENVATIRVAERDEVWVVVNRSVNGSTVRYVERFDWGNGEDNLDGFSDSYLTYSDPKTITGITQADPIVVTATAHGYSDGDEVKIISVVGTTEVNNKSYTVNNKAANTFELQTTAPTPVDVDGTAQTAYVSGGEVHKLVTTISGLTHLEGEVVQVKIDGAVHPDRTVATGAITLASQAYEVVVGLAYTMTITTLRKEYDIGPGTMQGQRTRWIRPVLRVYKSAKPLINDEFIPSRSAADDMDEKLPLFSGDLDYGPLDWGNTGRITVSLASPFPLQLSGIFGAAEGGVV